MPGKGFYEPVRRFLRAFHNPYDSSFLEVYNFKKITFYNPKNTGNKFPKNKR